MPRQAAFTLIEFLVVVTIIVVLLSLLGPAMDKAIYQAQLVQCAVNLRNIGGGAMNYATDNRRTYPRHPSLVKRVPPWQLSMDDVPAGQGTWDWRPMIRKHIPLKSLIDPLCQAVDLENDLITHELNGTGTKTRTYASVLPWFGYGFFPADGPVERGMFRVGDRFSWQGQSFNVLVSDADDVAPSLNLVAGSHPDDADVQVPYVLKNELNAPFRYTYSRWAALNTMVSRRGRLDTNYAYDDGAVHRYTKVAWDEGEPGGNGDRMVKVPTYSDASAWNNGLAEGWHLPRR